MSKTRKYRGISLMILAFSINANAQTCKSTPDCASLGYTKTVADCPSDVIKCP